MVVFVAKQVINGRKIKCHFPRELWLEIDHLEIDHHEGAECEMVEEKINLKILARYFEVNVASNESKAGSELEKEIS